MKFAASHTSVATFFEKPVAFGLRFHNKGVRSRLADIVSVSDELGKGNEEEKESDHAPVQRRRLHSSFRLRSTIVCSSAQAVIPGICTRSRARLRFGSDWPDPTRFSDANDEYGHLRCGHC